MSEDIVLQAPFMEKTMLFQQEAWGVGEDRSLVTYVGHGLRVEVPPELNDRKALIRAVVETALKKGSDDRAVAIQGALGLKEFRR